MSDSPIEKPIMDVTSNDLICNGGINPYITPVSTVVLKASAGATIGAQWHHGLVMRDYHFDG
jgi:hypothetical protein